MSGDRRARDAHRQGLVLGRWVSIVLVVAAVVPLSAIVVTQLLARPIGDDYTWLAASDDRGVAGFITWFLTGVTGRYSNGALMAVSLRVFGAHAAQVLPALLLGALVVGLALCAAQVLARVDAVALPARLKQGAALAIVFSTALAAVPSVYDGLVWFNAVAIFLASMAATAWLVAAYLWATARTRVRVVPLIVLGVLTIVTQGFAESTGIIVLAGAGVMFLIGLVTRRAVDVVASLTVGVLGAAGLIAVYLMPGTQSRLSIQDQIFPENSVNAVLAGAGDALRIQLTTLGSWRILPVLVIVVALHAFARDALRAHPVRAVVAGLGLAIVPSVLTCVTLYITVQSSPYRAMTLSYLLFDIGIALVAAGALTALAARIPLLVARPRGASVVARRAAAVVGLVVAASAVLLVVPLSSVVQATAERAGLVDARSAALRAQVAAHTEPVRVEPAPLLLASTEASEINYLPADQQIGWVLGGLADYFGFDPAQAELGTQQPAGYCLGLDRSAYPDGRDLAAYFGAVRCDALLTR
ncbi:hypothetical protein QT381_08085 [Galbitalea sp. SE-J8]|uniref:hypothetical protein n=1 Tax=Galbitalea sp. SE-J8 TaxID=3054952 RepID=UPI00259C68EF|nr:hypothetical protein [Galbitalea sp. SE-J8]MDM4762964.1 hypothetical protein [Galbitalea sp. SE-J8]